LPVIPEGTSRSCILISNEYMDVAKVVKQPPQDEEKKMQEIKEEEDIPGGGEDLVLSEEIPDVKHEEIPAREDLNNLEEINETAKEGDLEHIGNILPSTDHVNIA